MLIGVLSALLCPNWNFRPFFSIFIRKGYGLGAMAMAGGVCMGHEVILTWA